MFAVCGKCGGVCKEKLKTEIILYDGEKRQN